MTKLRVHELAKELGMENKDLMEILEKKNVEAKTSMSSIPDEVVAELRSGHAGKGTSEDAPKKKNIVQVFRPQNSKSGNRRSGGSRPGNGQNTQGTSRQDRPAGGRNGQRPASGQNGSRQDRPARGAAGKWRERTEDHRKDARQETDVRKRDREAVSVRIVRQMEETGSVRLLLQTVREETVARTRGQKMVSVRIPEETTEMTETTEIQFRRHW
ncbi:MAG: translation initiation factor IF-2 N-terminal domain-containing protein [Mediterraneibacter gnavus]